jgi:hypothetical protein
MGVQPTTRRSQRRDMAPAHFPNRKTFGLVSRVTGFQRAAMPSHPPGYSLGELPEKNEGKGPFPLIDAKQPQLGRSLSQSLRRGACPRLAPKTSRSLVFARHTLVCHGERSESRRDRSGLGREGP